MTSDPRRDVGELGERLAEDHLLRSGYRVLDRNFRTRAGELDLVAALPGIVVFCEVRTRVGLGRSARDAGGPLDSIGPRKRLRLRRMAREWLSSQGPRGRTGPSGGRELRFDAIGVVLGVDGELRTLEHLEDAF